jgi:hypothetical protein
MTSGSFSSARAAVLSPPQWMFSARRDAFRRPGQQFVHNATEFSVLIGGRAPRSC